MALPQFTCQQRKWFKEYFEIGLYLVNFFFKIYIKNNFRVHNICYCLNIYCILLDLSPTVGRSKVPSRKQCICLYSEGVSLFDGSILNSFWIGSCLFAMNLLCSYWLQGSSIRLKPELMKNRNGPSITWTLLQKNLLLR